jgi:hypothetical protein
VLRCGLRFLLSAFNFYFSPMTSATIDKELLGLSRLLNGNSLLSESQCKAAFILLGRRLFRPAAEPTEPTEPTRVQNAMNMISFVFEREEAGVADPARIAQMDQVYGVAARAIGAPTISGNALATYVGGSFLQRLTRLLFATGDCREREQERERERSSALGLLHQIHCRCAKLRPVIVEALSRCWYAVYDAHETATIMQTTAHFGPLLTDAELSVVRDRAIDVWIEQSLRRLLDCDRTAFLLRLERQYRECASKRNSIDWWARPKEEDTKFWTQMQRYLALRRSRSRSSSCTSSCTTSSSTSTGSSASVVSLTAGDDRSSFDSLQHYWLVKHLKYAFDSRAVVVVFDYRGRSIRCEMIPGKRGQGSRVRLKNVKSGNYVCVHRRSRIIKVCERKHSKRDTVFDVRPFTTDVNRVRLESRAHPGTFLAITEQRALHAVAVGDDSCLQLWRCANQ